jgi:hypothetical protein
MADQISDAGQAEKPKADLPTAPVPSDGAALKSGKPEDNIADASKLSPEEQMAAFEKELKEKDWGHQPC